MGISGLCALKNSIYFAPKDRFFGSTEKSH
jgi:hypothetical protein